MACMGLSQAAWNLTCAMARALSDRKWNLKFTTVTDKLKKNLDVYMLRIWSTFIKHVRLDDKHAALLCLLCVRALHTHMCMCCAHTCIIICVHVCICDFLSSYPIFLYILHRHVLLFCLFYIHCFLMRVFSVSYLWYFFFTPSLCFYSIFQRKK